ncbi:MAG: hypothetical protein ACYDC3_19290 [Candidatus Binataceae bacterium]
MAAKQIAVRLMLACAFAFAIAAIASAGNAGATGAMPMAAGDADAMSSIDMNSMHDSHMMSGGEMGDMKDHMKWTGLRSANPADIERGDQLVATLRTALAKYQDYHAAEAAGFRPFHPEFKNQKIVHFTKWSYALKAAFEFDPSEPTSLLYERIAGGGYKLVGAMYTAPRRWDAEQLNARVPLSVARWHQHIDICIPKKGASPPSADWTRFGPRGTITTEAECSAAGGRFFPVLFGWMVHVYPWETNPQEVWAH